MDFKRLFKEQFKKAAGLKQTNKKKNQVFEFLFLKKAKKYSQIEG